MARPSSVEWVFYRLRVAEASSGDAGAGDVVVSEPSHDRLGAFLRQGLVGGFRADVVGFARDDG